MDQVISIIEKSGVPFVQSRTKYGLRFDYEGVQISVTKTTLTITSLVVKQNSELDGGVYYPAEMALYKGRLNALSIKLVTLAVWVCIEIHRLRYMRMGDGSRPMFSQQHTRDRWNAVDPETVPMHIPEIVFCLIADNPIADIGSWQNTNEEIADWYSHYASGFQIVALYRLESLTGHETRYCQVYDQHYTLARLEPSHKFRVSPADAFMTRLPWKHDDKVIGYSLSYVGVAEKFMTITDTLVTVSAQEKLLSSYGVDVKVPENKTTTYVVKVPRDS